MNEEILSRLERIDHKEYSCGFEFADSSTFDEMARCFEERKILAKEIERLNNIFDELKERIKNNMQYDDNIDNCWTTTNELFEILDKIGVDKE